MNSNLADFPSANNLHFCTRNTILYHILSADSVTFPVSTELEKTRLKVPWPYENRMAIFNCKL